MGRGKAKKSRGKKYKGAQKTNKSCKYVSLIWDPFKRKCIWLGTYGNDEKALEMYISKKREFDEKLKAKQGIIEFLGFSQLKSTPHETESSAHDEDEGKERNQEEFIEDDDDDRVGDKEEGLNGNSEDQESEFGVLFGVRVIDRNGFLLGEFSKLDDLSFCPIEDDHTFIQ